MMGVDTTRTLARLEGVTCAYERMPVVDDVSLTVRVGDYLGVVGPSG
jgi:ABC-type transporter Mla maintaining outer membrane lipid asymmetry ATPase subunit MlaF